MALSDVIASRLSRPAGRVLDGPIREIVEQVLKEAGYASPAEMQQVRDRVRDLGAKVEQAEKRLAEVSKRGEEGWASADAFRSKLTTLEAAVAAAEKKASEARRSVQEASTIMPDPRVDTLEDQVAALSEQLSRAAGSAGGGQPTEGVAEALAQLPDIRSRLDVLSDAVASLEEWRADLPAVVRSEVVDVNAVPLTPVVVSPTVVDPVAVNPGVVNPGAVVTPVTPTPAKPEPLSAAPRGSCRVEGCTGTVRAKGFCSAHYQQWRRGTLEGFAAE